MEQKRLNIGAILLRILLVLAILAVIVAVTYFIMKKNGLTDVEGLRKYIEGTGFAGYATVVLLQIVQVLFIPVSNQIITAPATVIMGPVPAFFCSWIGITVGIVILYFIGRFGGQKLLSWVLGDERATERCIAFLKRGKYLYVLGMLMPFIPDDVLTTCAGTSKYPFRFVLPVAIVTRAICVFCTCFAVEVLLRHWWGIVLIVLAVGAMFFFTWLLTRNEFRKED